MMSYYGERLVNSDQVGLVNRRQGIKNEKIRSDSVGLQGRKVNLLRRISAVKPISVCARCECPDGVRTGCKREPTSILRPNILFRLAGATCQGKRLAAEMR